MNPPTAAQPSPSARPIKSEQVVPIMQPDISIDNDSYALETESLLILASQRKILMHQLAIVQEQIALDARKKKLREKSAKGEQLGASANDLVVV
jgi:hypothetical protein